MTLEAVSGVIATLLGVVFIWPQVVRAYRRDSVEGLSPLTTLICLAGSIFWTVFAYATERVIGVVANINVGIATSFVTVLLVRSGVFKPYVPLLIVSSALTYCLIMSGISTQTVGVSGLLISTPAVLPQVWRTLRSDQLFGVSITANVLFAIQCFFWTIYGFKVEEWLYIYPNAFLLPCALLIVWKVWRSRNPITVSSSVVSA